MEEEALLLGCQLPLLSIPGHSDNWRADTAHDEWKGARSGPEARHPGSSRWEKLAAESGGRSARCLCHGPGCMCVRLLWEGIWGSVQTQWLWNETDLRSSFSPFPCCVCSLRHITYPPEPWLTHFKKGSNTCLTTLMWALKELISPKCQKQCLAQSIRDSNFSGQKWLSFICKFSAFPFPGLLKVSALPIQVFSLLCPQSKVLPCFLTFLSADLGRGGLRRRMVGTQDTFQILIRTGWKKSF